MITEKECLEYIGDDELILKQIDKAPQTYNTLLGELKDNGTKRQILIRRIKKLCKQGRAWKLVVPGTRFGLALYTSTKSNYIIITSYTFSNINVYYTNKLVQDDDFIILKDYHKLSKPNWDEWIHSTKEIKIKKHSLREDGYTIWD